MYVGTQCLNVSLTPSLLKQDLSSESSSALISAYASYSDGFMNDVTDMPGLNVSSLAPSYFTVNRTVSNITVSHTGPVLVLTQPIPTFGDGLPLNDAARL